jgi:nucleoporin NUP159
MATLSIALPQMVTSKPQVPTSFPPPASSKVKNPFGAAQGGFELKSTFKGDGSAANDLPKANKTSSGSLSFGGSFDEILIHRFDLFSVIH